jgi:copper chaperone
MTRRTLTVTGMACDGCEQSVEDALEALDGVDHAEADHEAGTVTVDAEGAVSEADIAAAVSEAGYELRT